MILRTFYPIAHIHLVTTQQTWASSLKRQMVSFLNLCLVLPFFPQIEYQLVTISSQKTTKTFWAKLQIAWEMALIKANTCSIPVVFILSFKKFKKKDSLFQMSKTAYFFTLENWVQVPMKIFRRVKYIQFFGLTTICKFLKTPILQFEKFTNSLGPFGLDPKLFSWGLHHIFSFKK